MAKLTGGLAPIDLYSSTTTQPSAYMVGQICWDVNGKAFRYVLNGATAMTVGQAQQAPVNVGDPYHNMTVGTAGKAGDAYIQVTNGTSTITSQQFEGGSIFVYTAGTDVISDEYTIVAVTGTLTTGGALKVWLDRPLRAAITTSATVTMQPSPFSGVVPTPLTTSTGMCVGVAIYAIPANAYGWIQTHGPCSAIIDASAIVVGGMVGINNTVTGSLSAGGTAMPLNVYVGKALATAASGKGAEVFLNID
jgi:hypothetical protein